MTGALPFPDIDPVIFQIGPIALRWYALAYIVGIGIGYWLMARLLKRPALWPADTPPMAPARLEDLLTYIVIGVILGGRLGYVLFYRPDYYLANPLEIPAIWTGGLSFHGGFLGVVLAVLLFSRRHAVPLGQLSDLVALAATPAILLVRIANFINGELWGRPTDVPWAVVFPSDAAQDCPGVEGICARHPSQLYESGLEGLLLGLVLLVLATRFTAFRRPWTLSAVFFIGYGLARFIVEFVRQPDAQFVGPDNPLGWRLDFGEWGLTMGQLLSLPMILVGLAVLLTVRRR